MQGILWILDNGAKWKDLPTAFGSKSTVHRWFQIWTHAGVFERIMHDAGRVVGAMPSWSVGMLCWPPKHAYPRPRRVKA